VAYSIAHAGHHSLFPYFLGKEDFPSQVPVLTKELEEHFHLDPNLLDGTVKSLVEFTR
jgi:hypothetical protein